MPTVERLRAVVEADTADAERGIRRFSDTVEDSGQSFVTLDKLAKGAAAGVTSAFALAAVDMVTGQEAANDKLAAQLGATAEESGRYGDVAGKLYAGAYGDSLGTVNQAIKGVVQNVAGMSSASDADLQRVTASVLDVATAFDQDLGMTTAAVGQLIRTGLAKDATEALDIITVGLQSGANKADDLLETFNEYGTQFRNFGLNGAEATGLLSQGLQAGARDADVVADAIKEFSIRAIDGSKLTAEGFRAVGLDAGDMATKIGAGGDTAKAALDLTLDSLRAIEDPVKRDAAAVALFGTQAEDMGDALYSLDLSSATQAIGEVGGAAERMGQTLNTNASTNIESFKRQAQQAFVDVVGGRVLPILGSTSAFLTTSFGPAFSTVAGVLSGTVVPALVDVASWLVQNETPIRNVAMIITAVMIPALIVWATTATAQGAVVVAAWVRTQVAAVTSSALQVAAAYRTVGGWVAASAAAVANAAVMTATMAATAARVVAGWVLMATQSLLAAGRMAGAWLIAMGPIGWAIAAVVGLVALVIANWDTVTAATGRAWDWVSGKVDAATSFLRRIVAGAMGAIATTVAGKLAAVRATVSAVFTAVPQLVQAGVERGRAAVARAFGAMPAPVQNALRVITTVVQTGFRLVENAVRTALQVVVALLTGQWGKIPGIVRGGMDNARRIVSDAMGALRRSVGDGVTNVIRTFQGIPGRIRSALGNVGGMLTGAGRAIMRGLVQGIKDGIGRLRDTLGSVTDMIPDWKGPMDVDRRLLEPSGAAIMGGLRRGIDSQRRHLQRTLSAITRDVGATRVPELGQRAGLGRPAGALASRDRAERYNAVMGRLGGSSRTVNVNLGGIHNPQAEPTSRTVNTALARVAALSLGG